MDKKPANALVLGLIAAFGTWLLKISTPYGLGLTDDAISYIAAARALLAGDGFTRIWLATGFEPITHWPPGFPATLAFISSITHLDPYRSARILNGLLFGANAALLAFFGYKMSPPRSDDFSRPAKKGQKPLRQEKILSSLCSKGLIPYYAGIFLALLFLSNPALLRLHAQALSEPLYLFLSMAAFLVFAAAIEKGEKNEEKSAAKQLLLAGFISGLAYLTRYAALSLLATLIAAILILIPRWEKRLKALGTYLAGALPPILAWMLRNQLVGGSATNRAVQWHPVTSENLVRGARTFFRFLVPLPALSDPFIDNITLIALIPLLILLLLLLWLLPKGIKYVFSPAKNDRPPLLVFLLVLYIFSYLSSLLVSLTFFDAATPLNDRILSPVYLALLAIFVFFLARQRSRIGTGISVLLAILLLGSFVAAQGDTVAALQESPTGFASWRWRESSVMAAIRELPPDVAVYTNQPPALYFWTGRPAYPLWDEQPAALREGDAALAIFFPPQRESPEFQAWLAEMSRDLSIVEKSGLGNLYRKTEE